jgi:SAM-dependent methyltransferase
MTKKHILKGPYFPSHSENRMCDEGDTIKARNYFFNYRPANLNHLLSRRYGWMNEYINEDDIAIEVGCGCGFASLFIQNKIILTDTVPNPWVDLVVDAMQMPFENESVNVIVASQAIHHFSSPYKFFTEALRVLSNPGHILIQEINTSLAMRILLRIMRHEGWSYNIDVFAPDMPANNPNDPWSANCAVPEMLFLDKDKFKEVFNDGENYLSIEKHEHCEFFEFLLGGGGNR